ncbi:NADP-dependent oxidoreductase domain-containing protein 1 [Elgaria multicarinata webbii]|uniref:NADP-dependent oxidoreductase domain-containing protein 1 n=1 Tax=Elgaria multicarinata webbii TaxID=159646 RepID=UPI002FCCEA4F
MADIMANLKTFQPEYGSGTNEPLLRLKCRAKGLTVNACAHALFFCKMLQATRQKEEHLKIGIIGGGHIGKQLARMLLQLSGIPGRNIQISTRRPETLLEFEMVGVDCFYNNRQLVGWADVVFLCCLPSHLLHICSEIQGVLKKCCIIYSLITAIPLPRLQQLLSYNSILRPRYTFTDNGPFPIWEANRTVVETLKDPAVIQATCPCNPKGEVVVNMKWLAAVFYAALNSYTWQQLSYAKALVLLNEVCFPEDKAIGPAEDKSPPPFLACENFINRAFALSLEPNDSFPCFDLTTTQLKDSPFSQLLATSTSFKDSIASFYCNMIAISSTNNEESMTATSTRVSLSAVLLNPHKSLNQSTDETCIRKGEEALSTDSEDIN